MWQVGNERYASVCLPDEQQMVLEEINACLLAACSRPTLFPAHVPGRRRRVLAWSLDEDVDILVESVGKSVLSIDEDAVCAEPLLRIDGVGLAGFGFGGGRHGCFAGRLTERPDAKILVSERKAR